MDRFREICKQKLHDNHKEACINFVMNIEMKQKIANFSKKTSSPRQGTLHPADNKNGARFYLLFYDTGCCDMFSQYAAIDSIGKRASKEFLNF